MFDGPGRTVANDIWCTTATTTTLFGVPVSLSARNCYLVRSYGAFLAIRLGCVIELMPFANVKSKPCHHCGCAGDTTICRLGDAGSIAFLRWFFPRTEPPVQFREVGPVQRNSSDPDLQRRSPSCLPMSNWMRTAAAVAWEPAANMALLVLALYLIGRGCCSSVYCSSTGCCGSTG